MVWLIGNKGMLGTELANALAAAGIECVGTDREVDISDPAALSAFASGKAVDWIVNCAAYTAVEKAEDEAELCSRLNAEGPANIAATARSSGAKLLHISTDYVFDGTGARPYLEEDPVAPIGVYGRTKAEGEARVRELCPEHVIVRTAWLYGRHGPNFVYTMLRLMRAKERIGVVADQRGTPTHAADLAAAIVSILRSSKTVYGTFHFTDLGETNWHEFALAIHRLGREHGILERDCAVDALTTAQYPTKVRRPAYSVLSKDRIVAAYGLSIPAWEDSIAAFSRGIAAVRRRQVAWNVNADYDMRTAEVDAAAGQFRPAVFWCQQAVEKTLKALVEFYDRPSPVHDLLRLCAYLRLAPDADKRELMKRLTQWYRDARYDVDQGSMDLISDLGTAKGIILDTKETIAWIRSQNRLPIA